MKDAEKFKNYLTDRGAVVLPPTNPWEVVRFRTENGVSVVYTNKNGHLTFTGESQSAYDFYKSGRKWTPPNRRRQSLKAQKQKLAERDGKICWFHGEKLDYDQLTIEHLLEHSKGGNDHPFNLCLACEDCNREVQGMSVTEKMLYRDKMRAQYLKSLNMPKMYVDEAASYTDEQWAELEEGLKHIKPGHPIIIHTNPQGENFFHKIFRGKR